MLTAFEINRINAENFLVGRHSLLRETQLRIELAQLEVGDRNGGDKGSFDHVSRVTSSEKIGSCCLGRSAELSPEVDSISQLQAGGVEGRRSAI